MTKREEWVFLNGRVVPADEAMISVFDAGFAHAAGLFETLRAYRGRVMRLDDHVDRLVKSAGTLGLQIPIDKELIRRGVFDVLQVNEFLDARLRILLTPGNVPRPGQLDDQPTPPTLLVTAGDVRPYPPELYKSGMRVCICPYKQNRLDPLAGHKTLAYLPRLMAMKDAAQRRCNESLWFTTENCLAEGSVCNVFIVHEGTVVTPPLDTPVLPGTVRKAVIDLSRDNGITIEERAIDIETLLAAKEVFLTGSVLEIMSVTSIEKHQVGEGVPGEVTKRMAILYKDLVALECGG
jgi:branched-chain amino acid aminotransferase